MSNATKGEEPTVGTIWVKYGKRKMHRAICSTCSPQWKGRLEDKKQDAFHEAILHAIEVHRWIPKFKGV